MIFVTGASGFIGRHLVMKALSEGYELVVLTRNADAYKKIGSEIVIEGDLIGWESWYSQLSSYGIETCVHLAWEGIPDYSFDCSEKNLLNGLSVLRICEKIGVKKLIITGSCWEYKNPHGCISTNHELDYSNPFKAAKQSLHMMASAFCAEKGIHLNWLRLFYVYGPGQKRTSLIPYIINTLMNQDIIELNGAYNKNDFVYVADVADAIIRVMVNNGFPEVLNVGSGYSTRVVDIAKCISEILNIEIDENSYVTTGNETDFYADAEEMNVEYGWKAKTELKSGIAEMLKEKNYRGDI